MTLTHSRVTDFLLLQWVRKRIVKHGMRDCVFVCEVEELRFIIEQSFPLKSPLQHSVSALLIIPPPPSLPQLSPNVNTTAQ